MPDDNTNAVENTGQEKHRERDRQEARQSENHCRDAEPGDAPEQGLSRVLHRRQIRDEQRHDERSDSRGGPHPAEPNRPAMQNLVGKDRQEGGRAPEEDREHIERDRGEDDLFTHHESQTFLEAPPGVALTAAPVIATPNGQDEKEKRKRTGRVHRINEWKPSAHNQHSSQGRANHGSDLEDAAIPGDGVREDVARNELWKVRAPRCPTESAASRRDEEDQVDQRDRKIVKVKISVAFEDCRDGKKETVPRPEQAPVWNREVMPGNECQREGADRAERLADEHDPFPRESISNMASR